MSSDFSKITQLLKSKQENNETVILEPEGMQILKSMGISVPDHIWVHDVSTFTKKDLSSIDSEKIVLKVVSPTILHKSDVGGVKILNNDFKLLKSELEKMSKKFGSEAQGFLICECINFDAGLSGELLVGLRNTPDFGPILTFGSGGIYTEFLAENFNEGQSVAILTPELMSMDVVEKALQKVAVTKLISREFRGQPPRIQLKELAAIVQKFLNFSREYMPNDIIEFEVNPFALTDKGLVALDILIKLNNQDHEQRTKRPIHKIKELLQPQTAAIVGVSEKMNVGHIILNNFIKEGFSRDGLFIVKEGSDEIEGCKCFPNVASLPTTVDLVVLCTPASTIPGLITEFTEHEKAHSMIVIPGGLEEKKGSEAIVQKMRDVLEESRKSKNKGPVINGGNCLGVISKPGKYNTMFIPDYKKGKEIGPEAPLAFISQSGAFAVSRLNKLVGINPKYSITIGNQMDLTLGDYLTFLKDDKSIEIFSIYLEGFKPLDGKQFIKAAKEITQSGRTIIFYPSGRTAEGAKAMASHTASIAGDFLVTQELCQEAGIILANSFEEFEDLTNCFTMLRDKKVAGKRLGVVSNAGAECVAASDNINGFTLTQFTRSTESKLQNVFKECRIDSIVDLHNPIDLTPMAGDRAYAETIRAMLDDTNVDVAIIANIPLAPTLNALPKNPNHREDYLSPNSIVQHTIEIFKSSKKAWLAVIDAGPLFDPMAQLFIENGIPTFRTIDRALKIFDKFCSKRINLLS